MGVKRECINPDCPSDGSTDLSDEAVKFSVCSVCDTQMTVTVTDDVEIPVGTQVPTESDVQPHRSVFEDPTVDPAVQPEFPADEEGAQQAAAFAASKRQKEHKVKKVK